jgi:hypothetical protein
MIIGAYGGEDDVRLAQTRITAKQAGGLVKGNSGDATVSIKVGSTTTLDPGALATVTNSGNDVNAIFNFGIPTGLPGVDGTFADIPDGAIVRNKLEPTLVDELQYDQAVMSWTGSQVIVNNVSFNLVTLLTPASISRNTINLVLNTTTKVLTFTPRTFDQNIRIVARLVGTIGGATGTAREFFVELTRPGASGTLLARDSIVKINDNNISNRQASIDTYVVGGTSDLFFTQGFEVKLNNLSTQNITLTSFTLLFFG